MSRLLEYRCDDPVNRNLVSRWLTKVGADLTEDSADATAFLIDLDHLPFGRSWAEVMPGPAGCPAALHGYHISPHVRRDCRRWGVRIVRRLTRRLLRELLPLQFHSRGNQTIS